MTSISETRLRRLLSQPFNIELFRNKVGMGLYIENGFRITSLSSNASRRDTENSISRFNNALRLRGDKAIAKSACRLGYCDYGHLVDPKANAKELTHPARRLVNEIFWLYLPQEIVTSLQTEESLANPAARDIIKNAVQSNGDISKVLVNHAMAIMYHTAAISNEVDFLLGRAKPDDRLWQQAYQFWKLVFSDDAFWGHIEHRIATLDDFRLKSKDIAELKDKIPRIVLSFNSVFGKYYAKSGEKNQLKRHLGFINQSGFEKKNAWMCWRASPGTAWEMNCARCSHVSEKLSIPIRATMAVYRSARFEKIWTAC